MTRGLTPLRLSRRAFAAGGAAAVGAGLAARGSSAQDATPALPTPPIQPATGPGGGEYRYASMVTTAPVDIGGTYWLFAPGSPIEGDASLVEGLPVVIFVTGCCEAGSISARPDYFRAWIDHIVRKGAIVIYPRYSGLKAVESVGTATATAFSELETTEGITIDREKVVVMGASYGGHAAVKLVASPPDATPRPSALMVMMTDDIPTEVTATIPENVKVLVLGAAQDLLAADSTDRFWEDLVRNSAVPSKWRTYVKINSDTHGSPFLMADHGSVATNDFFVLDALDWYGSWKLLDALMACSFEGEWCDYAFGNTPEVRFMGTWSDGVPVAEAVVVGETATPTP